MPSVTQQWFYLRNDEGLLPPYNERIITARLEHWKYGVPLVRQPRLCPLLNALKRLRQEGLMAALVLLIVHHQGVLQLMAHPLRMDEMGPHAAVKDLEACRMSGEALLNKEVTTRVRAALSSAF